MSVAEITSEQFTALLTKPGYIVIDFSAEWCPPCKVMKPILESFSNDPSLSKLAFATIDVDEVPDVSQQFGVMSIPTFVFLKTSGDGKYEEVKRMIGAQDALTFKSYLQEFASSVVAA